jgi:hypothetical protein
VLAITATKQRLFSLVLLAVLLPLARARAEAPQTAAVILLGPRQAQAAPERHGFTHTGAGNIEVTQPAPNIVVVTMTGAAMAGPHPCQDSSASIPFNLEQAFEISFRDPKVKRAKIVLDAHAVGALRSHSAYHCSNATGSAEVSAARAEILASGAEVASIELTPHAVAGNDLAINDRVGPLEAAIVPGKYTLRQTFAIAAAHPERVLPASSASAEFAPEPALDPMWLGLGDPFHAAAKKNYGFQVTIKVVAEP